MVDLYRVKEKIIHNSGVLKKPLQKLVAKRWTGLIAKEALKSNKEETEFCPVKHSDEKELPRVAIVVYAFIIGGGEIFPIYLANALKKLGYPVILINCNMEPEDPKVANMVRKDVTVINLDRFSGLARAINENNINIIHTHHYTMDYVISCLIQKGLVHAKQLITLHGGYEMLDEPRARMLIDQTNNTCSKYFYIADKNLKSFYRREDFNINKFSKIANGASRTVHKTIRRSDLGIPEDAFVLCLVSRALFRKGWEQAFDAVILANRIRLEKNPDSQREIHLILVGEGEAYDKLSRRDNPYVHLVGAHQNTKAYFAIADVGFLPSWYKGESFPLVIIDSLFCGKPVLASSLGEIPTMLSTETGLAGWLISLENATISVPKLANMILNIYENPDDYENKRNCVEQAADRYDIMNIAKKYYSEYIQIL